MNTKKLHLACHAPQVVGTRRGPRQLIGPVARLARRVGDQHASWHCQPRDPAGDIHGTAEPVPGAGDGKAGGHSRSQLPRPAPDTGGPAIGEQRGRRQEEQGDAHENGECPARARDPAPTDRVEVGEEEEDREGTCGE